MPLGGRRLARGTRPFHLPVGIARRDAETAQVPRRNRRQRLEHHVGRRAAVHEPARHQQAAEAARGRARRAALHAQGQEPGRDHAGRPRGHRAGAQDPARGRQHHEPRERPHGRARRHAVDRDDAYASALRAARGHPRVPRALSARRPRAAPRHVGADRRAHQHEQGRLRDRDRLAGPVLAPDADADLPLAPHRARAEGSSAREAARSRSTCRRSPTIRS